MGNAVDDQRLGSGGSASIRVVEPRPTAFPSRWALVAIALAYLVLYGRTVTFGYVWDDPANSAASELLRGPLSTVIRRGENIRIDAALGRMPKDIVPSHESYRPVAAASHWLDVHLFHDRPSLLHAHNVLLGLLSLLLVWRLSRRLDAGPWLTGVWALHPLHVEVFAYISARSELLAAIFALIAVLAALRSSRARGAGGRWGWAVAAALTYFVSLFCKEAILPLPLAILLWSWLRGQARLMAPSVAAMCAGVALYFPVRNTLMLSTSLPMVQIGLLVRSFWELPGLALAYVASFFAPFSLSPDRQFWPGYVPLGFVLLAVMLASYVVALRRVSREQRPALMDAAGALLAFGLMLGPAAFGVRSVGAQADRYVFFPLLFLVLGLLSLARLVPRPSSPLLWRVPLALWAGLLLITTAVQIGAWRDDEALARHAVAMDPNSSAGLFRAATVLTSRGDFRAALPLLEQAVAQNPHSARVLNNLAVTYLNLGRIEDAKATLRKALPLAGATDRKFWYNVASVQLAAGKTDRACGALARALEIDPGYALALSLRQQVCPPSFMGSPKGD